MGKKRDRIKQLEDRVAALEGRWRPSLGDDRWAGSEPLDTHVMWRSNVADYKDGPLDDSWNAHGYL